MAAFIYCFYATADSYIPLLDTDKEWGYVQYGANYVNDKNCMPYYFRIGIQTEKYRLSKSVGAYAKFMQWGFTVQAYMREDNGKVYAEYTDKINENKTAYYRPGKEYLLYDFNMQAGESLTLAPRSEGEECIVLKCVETGTIETESGPRKFLRFDTSVNETTRRWMAYEYLLEGVGPIGDCSFMMPYKSSEETPDAQRGLHTELLYQRIAHNPYDYEGDDDDQLPIVYTTPCFDVMGMFDPSVWCWKTKDPSASVELPSVPALPDRSINLVGRDGVSYIVSGGADLTEVTVFDVLGRTLARYTPCSREFRLDLGGFDTKMVIVRAATSNGSRSFKLDLCRVRAGI